VKYQHNSSIQFLAFNPVNYQLASLSCNDFGFWARDQDKVLKFSIPSKGLCCSWNPDGTFLAIGLIDGNVLVRDSSGGPKWEILRSSPIWCLEWNPTKGENDAQLLVGCWDETLSLWDIEGKQIGTEKNLGFDPCSISFYPNGEFFALGGSDKNVTIWTKELVCLGTICKQTDWIWSVRVRPKANCIGLSTNDGKVAIYQIGFSIVHGLHEERYAYRELMTNVIIQHLVTEQKVKIKCRDLVKKISVYKERLAVQVSDRIIVYAAHPEDEQDLKYKTYKKINQNFECNMMVLTYNHVVLCADNRMQLVNFTGEVDREWNLESTVKYIKVIGGMTGKEGLVIGLKNGQVLKLFIDNPFPIILLKHIFPIKCVDISLYKQRVAFVDENSNLSVFDLKKQEIIFKDTGVMTVAYNSEIEDLLAYSGQGKLSIKTENFPAAVQNLMGFVVGFKGSKVFSLHYITMNMIDVPQSTAMYKYLEQKNCEQAYKMACLGVTDTDWMNLAIECIQNHNFSLARKAFTRNKDIKYLELVNKIEVEKRSKGYNDFIMMGDVSAFQGKFNEAASLYEKGEDIMRIVEMFRELKQWDKAENYIKKLDKEGQKKLLMDRAADSENSDWQVAARLFLNLNDYKKALSIIAKNNDDNWMIEICRQLNKADNSEAIQFCANYFRKAGNHAYAKEAYLKLGDLRALLNLHVELEKWEEAFRVVKQNPELKAALYIPYAEWLVNKDKFEEAREAYKEANDLGKALKLIQKLTNNAINEKRFKDAGFFYWRLANEHLSLIKDCMKPTQEDAENFTVYEEYRNLSEIYYCYSKIHRYAELPFLLPTPNYEESIFYSCRFLLNSLPGNTPQGINKLYVYYSLGRIATKLGAFSTARSAYEKLQNLKVPLEWQEEVEHSGISVKSKPNQDKEELFSVCYRCMNTSPSLTTGDFCSYCKHPIIRSFLSFQQLPLVEFEPNSSIPQKKVMQLLNSEIPVNVSKAKGQKKANEWHESLNVEYNQDSDDLFIQKVNEWIEMQAGQEDYQPVVVDEACLGAIPPQEVFIFDMTEKCPSLPKKFYRLMMPELDLHLCKGCGHFFIQDEFDLAFLELEACPFCALKEKDEDE
jgi:intraflagellar transport protein 122